MSTNEAKQAYLHIHASEFFASDQLSGRAEILNDALKGVLDAGTKDITSATKMTSLGELTPKCKFAVTAMTAANLSKPVMLRGYPGRSSPIQCTLLEALLATLSDAQVLPPVAIGESITEFFVATTTGRCNPMESLLEEIPSIFEGKSISVIVSVGSGRPSPVALRGRGDFASAVLDLAKSSHAVSQSMVSRFSGHPGVFVRIDVDGFDHSGIIQPHELISHSRAYLVQEEIRTQMDAVIHSLKYRPKRLEINHISGLQQGILERINNTLDSVLSAEESRILGKLNVSRDAPFTSVIEKKVQRQSCTPGTRIAILQQLLDWSTTLTPELKNSLFWLYGLAGTGKTTILRDICERLQELNLLASSYFCSIQLTSGDSKHLVPTIARHLASHSQAFKAALVLQLRQDPDLFFASLKPQFEYLLCKPWRAAANENVGYAAKIVIVDALDECDQGEEFLSLLLYAIEEGQLEGIQFIVSSRPVPRLLAKVRAMRPDSPQVSLHEVPKEEINGDIKRYFEANLALPSPRIKELVARADGLFIYASTLVKYLSPSQLLAPKELERRLEKVLAQTPERSSINPLYEQIVNVALSLDDDDSTRIRWTILHAISCAAEPPSANVVAGLLGIDPQVVTALVESLYSVMFTTARSGPIYIFHASFHDFIISHTDGKLSYYPLHTHSALAQACLAEMSKSLRFNICHLESSFIPDEDLNPPVQDRICTEVGDFLVYASRNWLVHIKRCDEMSQFTILPHVERVLRAKGIFWIELMSLLGDIRRCKEVLTELISSSSIIRIIPAISQIGVQAAKLVSVFDTLPVKITSHLYLSCLALAEETSESRHWIAQFSILPRVMSQQLVVNRSCQMAVKVGASIFALALSPDGKHIVSGSFDNTVCLWDAESGRQLRKLVGHTNSASSVAFSPDGKRIVSGSDDKTIWIWDAESGKQLRKLVGHTLPVSSVAFSPDGKRIVSGSDDKTVRIWNAKSGTELRKLVGHTHFVTSVAFSPDGKRIVSGSDDNNFCIWDAESGEQLRKLIGHTNSVLSVVFSPDGKRVVSGSSDNTVCIWSVKSGKQLRKLVGHTNSVASVAFSPNGKRIVSGSKDKTVRVWDFRSGKQLRKLVGHTDLVSSVTFSPDGKLIVSGSDDEILRVWDAESEKQLRNLRGHIDSVWSTSFSPDGKWIVSGSSDETARVWDAESGKQLLKIDGHTGSVISVAFSPDGRRIVSGSDDRTLRIWDAKSGKQLRKFVGHTNSVWSVAFSPDGNYIVSGSTDGFLCVWSVESGKQLRNLRGHSRSVLSVAFSPNGQRIVSGSSDKTVRIWEVGSGKQFHNLRGHIDFVRSVTFSSDGKRIVSGSSDNTVRIWDAESGKQLCNLQGHANSVRSVAFSPDAKHAVSGSVDSTVRVWDAKSGKQLRKLVGHTHSVSSVAFSPDGKRIVSGSDDKTVRIWSAQSRKQLLNSEGHTDIVGSVVFPADIKRLEQARNRSVPEPSMLVLFTIHKRLI
ncbi:quinon protein alcohol dehydrogenase-like superfamily [Flagelloscypha sp. PMI_526]|nr:quinon protein alcohol dehydrogenase-like superfamily [Flagelloscypha sp. PMI_526]